MRKMSKTRRMNLSMELINESKLKGKCKGYLSVQQNEKNEVFTFSAEILTEENIYTISIISIDQKSRIIFPKFIVEAYDIKPEDQFLIYIRKDLNIGINIIRSK